MTMFRISLLLRILAFVACGFAAAGCSSSTYVSSSDQGTGMTVALLNRRLQNEEVTISFADGAVAHGKGFHVERDSAFWSEAQSGNAFHSPLSGIRTVSTGPNRFIGALLGFGTGAAAGALLGWRIADGSAAHGEDHGLAIAVGTIVGSGGGAIIGTIVGIATAPPHVYSFVSPTADR